MQRIHGSENYNSMPAPMQRDEAQTALESERNTAVAAAHELATTERTLRSELEAVRQKCEAWQGQVPP
jgi:phosphoribosylcarboxyaminoimidazole (NCAIR) mutase